MNSIDINYLIRFSETDDVEAFDFHLNQDNFELITKTSDTPPPWTELSYRQCSHCPLSQEKTQHCPVALNIFNIVDRFSDKNSIDTVEMEVITAERRVIQKTELQHAVASMLNFIFPSCGCPKTEKMKPLSRFHLPIASEEEHILRITSMFLLGNYLQPQKTSTQSDFEGLEKFFSDMNILNRAIASRLQLATDSDACKNAVTLLDMYATLIPVLLEDQLGEMREFFKGFLSSDNAKESKSQHIEMAKTLDLAPIEDTDKPEWLKQLSPTKKKENHNVENSNAADKILQASSLSLSLEPINEPGNGS